MIKQKEFNSEIFDQKCAVIRQKLEDASELNAGEEEHISACSGCAQYFSAIEAAVSARAADKIFRLDRVQIRNNFARRHYESYYQKKFAAVFMNASAYAVILILFVAFLWFASASIEKIYSENDMNLTESDEIQNKTRVLYSAYLKSSGGDFERMYEDISEVQYSESFIFGDLQTAAANQAAEERNDFEYAPVFDFAASENLAQNTGMELNDYFARNIEYLSEYNENLY